MTTAADGPALALIRLQILRVFPLGAIAPDGSHTKRTGWTIHFESIEPPCKSSVQRGLGRGTMRLTKRSDLQSLLSKIEENSDGIVFAILLTAFCFVTITFCRALALPFLLVCFCLILGWRGGRTVGLAASVIATLFFGILHRTSGNIRIAVCFLLFCCTASWLVGSLRDQWKVLQRQRDEMRVMLDHAPIGIALFDVKRKVLHCNPAFREIYGFDGQDIIGAVPPLPESQRRSWDDLVERLQAGKSFVSVETVRAQRDGTQFYARISGSPVFDHSGKLMGLVGVIAKADDGGYSDQLELRNLESLVQSSSDLMCVANLERRMYFLNDAGRDIVGLPYDHDVEEGSLEGLFAEEDRPRITAMLATLRDQKVGLTAQALRLRHIPTGTTIAVSCSFFVISDPLTQEASSFACVAKSIDPIVEQTPRFPNG